MRACYPKGAESSPVEKLEFALHHCGTELDKGGASGTTSHRNHLIMRRVGDHYEAVLAGKTPDTFMIEVGDIALGYPDYVTSLPQKLTNAPVVERVSRGSRPRLWEPPPRR